MSKEDFEKYYPNLMKWYKEGDCCNEIVELRQLNEQLKSQLQQKENIIKEAREYLINTNYDSDLPKLMGILNKENKNEQR